jgi:hypothetical protein
MDREWCRGPQWLSGSARREWEPVLRAAQQAWAEIELASLSAGVRRSALIFLDVADLPAASATYARAGYETTVLQVGGSKLRAAVHERGLATDWHSAWEGPDNEAVGRLLGFPECCIDFFDTAWVQTGARDVTFRMAEVDGPWEANTMLRHLGVRLVPHLPCSASCGATVDLARAMHTAGRAHKADVAALEAVLRLPVSHDASSEVAIVETPYFRVSVGADPWPARRVATRAGQLEPRTWNDNGFASYDAMERSHRPIIEALRPAATSALDLGCGDGRLLWTLARGQRRGRWVGVESDMERARRGALRYGPTVEFAIGKISERYSAGSGGYDVALVMPGRLLEMDPADADRLRQYLRASVSRVVAYAYGDVLSRYAGGLGELASLAGLRLVGPLTSELGSAASLAEVAP